MTIGKTLAILGFSLAGAVLAEMPAQAAGFTAANLRGAYGYTLTGTVGDPARSYVETGRIVADGRGSLTAEGTAVLDGATVLEISFACTYTVSQTGILAADCSSARSQNRFVGPILSSGLEARFIALPPTGQTVNLVGYARKQIGLPF